MRDKHKKLTRYPDLRSSLRNVLLIFIILLIPLKGNANHPAYFSALSPINIAQEMTNLGYSSAQAGAAIQDMGLNAPNVGAVLGSMSFSVPNFNTALSAVGLSAADIGTVHFLIYPGNIRLVYESADSVSR